MICPDNNDMRGANEEVPPVFEWLCDCQKFSVPDRVVSFCQIQCLRVISHITLLSFVILLEEDGSNGK